MARKWIDHFQKNTMHITEEQKQKYIQAAGMAAAGFVTIKLLQFSWKLLKGTASTFALMGVVAGTVMTIKKIKEQKEKEQINSAHATVIME